MDDLELGYLMSVAGALVWTPRPLRQLLDALGSAHSIVEWARSDAESPPSGAEPLRPDARARVAAVDDLAAQAALADNASSGAAVLLESDADYPAALRDLCDRPPLLYARGDPRALSGRCVAVVGSRAATTYGRSIAHAMAGDFGAYDACVVSGLARGVDAAAHRGALDAGTRTAAVIGSGLAALYPPYHSLLADEIVADGGVVLSEFPPLLAARAHQFPMRNRIVAALAAGTVVVEAGTRSGALITARLADEIGHAVFAVPGDVGRPTSAGTNALIQDGVPLVTSTHDVARLLGWNAAAAIAAAPTSSGSPGADPLLRLIGMTPASVEELCDRAGLDAATIVARLTLLEIRGLVERSAGGYAAVKQGVAPKRERR